MLRVSINQDHQIVCKTRILDVGVLAAACHLLCSIADQSTVHQGDEARLELGSFCQKWGARSSYVLSLNHSSKDRELQNEIRSALYFVRTNYGTDIHS